MIIIEMTIGHQLASAQRRLKASGINSARLDAQILLEQISGHNRAWLLAHPEQSLTPSQIEGYSTLIGRRAKREPIAHLTGQREFYGLDLSITPDVMIPRVETEKMVDLAIQYAPKNSKLIDIGTGSGAIALAVAYNRPDLEVTATEISQSALEVAQSNANKHKLNTKFIRSNLFESIDRRFNTVVTNLPYLSSQAKLLPEALTEPSVALFSDPGDGLELYRRFLDQLPSHLEPNGYLFTESDPWQQPDLIEAAEKINLKVIEQDYFILGFQLKS